MVLTFLCLVTKKNLGSMTTSVDYKDKNDYMCLSKLFSRKGVKYSNVIHSSFHSILDSCEIKW